MENSARERLLGLLREGLGSELGRRVVKRVISNISDEDICRIVGECEEMAGYDNWLSEREARDVVSGFVNLDGSKGPHWCDADTFFSATEALGISPDCPSKWNRWAWYVTINMVWSDEWGVLSAHVQNPV